MKVKIRTLEGIPLGWAVAKCEGYEKRGALKADRSRILIPHPDGGGQIFRPWADWRQGGPILTREQISRFFDPASSLWFAYTERYGEDVIHLQYHHSSELVAAQACAATWPQNLAAKSKYLTNYFESKA